MPIYHPHELSEFLVELGRGAKRTLSQNFLIDGNIVRKIVALIQPSKDDIIIEIGPGPGAVTEAILFPDEQAAYDPPQHLIGIEKDDQFASQLHRFKKGGGEISPLLTVIHSDVLSCDLSAIARRCQESDEKGLRAKIVSNVPYHLTTEIIEHIFKFTDCIESVTLMLQNEVAKKISSSSKSCSWLSFIASYYADVEYGFFVSRSCFTPVPNVDSAVVFLKPFNRVELLKKEDESHFFCMVKYFFSMKRKTIARGLTAWMGDKEKAQCVLEQSGLDPTLRPQNLLREDWKTLFLSWKAVKNIL